MRTVISLASLAFLSLAACSGRAGAEDDGEMPTARTYQVGSFDAISLGGAHDVVVRTGGAPSVRAEGPGSTLDRLEIDVEGGVLRIRDKGSWFSGGNDGEATIHVTVPALTAASIGGSGDIRIDRISGSSFRGAVGGSGDLLVGTLEVQDARFSIGGSGSIEAGGGRSSHIDLSIAGSGDVDAGGVSSRTARVSIAGSGDALVNVSDVVRGSVAGSGDVTVRGAGRCEISIAGSGGVHCSG
jgi:hypothetical protein